VLCVSAERRLDSFTRMEQAQEEERQERRAEYQNKLRAAAEHRDRLASFRREVGRSCSVSTARGSSEQTDGVIELDGELYLVEVKWWGEPLGPGEVAQHLVRVFSRGHARGIFVSASEYTAAAVLTCKESLARAVFVLCALEEFAHLVSLFRKFEALSSCTQSCTNRLHTPLRGKKRMSGHTSRCSLKGAQIREKTGTFLTSMVS
jgi:hypothetical protein